MCDGVLVLLISLGFPMVFIKEEFYSHFFLLCIWTVNFLVGWVWCWLLLEK